MAEGMDPRVRGGDAREYTRCRADNLPCAFWYGRGMPRPYRRAGRRLYMDSRLGAEYSGGNDGVME